MNKNVIKLAVVAVVAMFAERKLHLLSKIGVK